ncbi:uncharacterized protein LOC121260153 [Juglans microcarpa x Juglans regia]|uniref:uncharacterized protein LOC121260153 n=1 Tax=Juglans microcarpa x Juglans regia TaxID=2249226 RepID=UPI001B7D9BDB|nr:uncharacterized protein LOC121260153 [Juglans microcarpa x Juglans regia]
MKQQKVKEFASLVQGSMSMEQYAAKFMELGRFAPHQISTEKMQAQKFQVGLQPWINIQVVYLQIENYQELVNVVAIIEAGQRGLTTHINLEKKRAYQFVVSGSLDNKRVMTEANKGKDIMIGGQMPSPIPICRKFGRKHGVECKLASRACFNCDQLGHMKKDYPIEA